MPSARDGREELGRGIEDTGTPEPWASMPNVGSW